jgi:hypothetical protein
MSIESARELDREIGNVLDRWEMLCNDLRSDPGFELLDRALGKLYAVRVAQRLEPSGTLRSTGDEQ